MKFTVIIVQTTEGRESAFGIRHVEAERPREAAHSAINDYRWHNGISDNADTTISALYTFPGYHESLDLGDLECVPVPPLPPELESVLATLENTLKMIAGDYPNASKEYKRSSFVVGAQDMAMTFAGDRPFPERMAFARRVDEIRNRIFPGGPNVKVGAV